MDIPTGEGGGQVGGFADHAVAFVRPGNREADAGDLCPIEFVLREKNTDGGNPVGDDAVRAVLRRGGMLQQFGGDGLAVFPDGGDFGGRRAAVRADEDFFAHA